MMQSEPRMDIVPIDLVKPGDKIEIRSGELIPADGRIIEGTGALNKAPLTGESVPVDVRVGDTIEAGLVLAQGPVLCEVLAVGNETRLSGLIDAVHTFRRSLLDSTAALRNSPPSGFRWSCSGRLPFGISHSRRIGKSSSLWVVSCPCALLLATPVPHAAALANAASEGGCSWWRCAGADGSRESHLARQNGTLTSGKPKFGELVMGKGRRKQSALQVMMGLESKSNHPYAVSIVEHCENEGIKAANIKQLADIEAGVSCARNHRGGVHSSRQGRSDGVHRRNDSWMPLKRRKSRATAPVYW